jgi:peptidoglycan-N-acetylglucosamine deacetylase
MHVGSIGLTLLTLVAALSASQLAQAACPTPGQAIGVSRVVEIDTSGGPIYGSHTKFQKEATFLEPKEVVLTFDDGPAPAITRSVLATLDAHCTKATFFMVGRMAIAYPSAVKDVIARGHTVGAHTWSHPMGLGRLKPEVSRDEIERGFTAIAMSAGAPIAPFFRFPGLGDNQELLSYLQTRGIGTFTVDVISNDSFITSTDRLIKTTLERVEQHQGGIVLFHDIKQQTAMALPTILNELHARGYKVVHLRSKHGYEPEPAYVAALQSALPKTTGRPGFPTASGQAAPAPLASLEAGLPVTPLAPVARPIVLATRHSQAAQPRNPIVYGAPSPWITSVRRSKGKSRLTGEVQPATNL